MGVLCSAGPDGRLGLGIVLVDVIVECFDQFPDASEHAASQALFGKVSEKPLHHIEPGGTGGREVDVKAEMSSQPALDLWVLLGGVVVGNDVQLLVGRRSVVDEP